MAAACGIAADAVTNGSTVVVRLPGSSRRQGYADGTVLRPPPSFLLRDTRPPLAAGIAAGVVAVTITTLLIFPLREVAPANSTGVVYLLAVLLVATWFGLWVGLGTAVASALAFNYFHIPPTGRFTIAEPQNWVALIVFLVAASIASTLAEIARARTQEAVLRRREADLAADLARLLLGGSDVRAALPAAAERLAQAFELGPGIAIELGRDDDDADGSVRARRRGEFPTTGGGNSPVLGASDDDHHPVVPLRQDERRIGTLRLREAPDADTRQRLRERVVPSLEAILGVALQREALQLEIVETQALRRSDDIKTALLRAVSHDLRSPLTAIATAGEALQSATLTDAEREELGAAVMDEAQRLSRLVDKLLDLSRLQGGAADPRREWCSVDEVLRVAIDETPHAPGFNVAIDPDLPLVRADAAQLERAFANLLENAARYGGTYPVAVRARVVGHRMLIRIVDRGPGIPGPQLERVFEPFYRAPSSHGDGHVGSGLGLAVVRGFVEANGGRVWAESLPGQGTTFVVELPLDPEPDEDEGDDAAPSTPIRAGRAG
jgi:two-component system sensor histidine kinase KdpD